MKNFIVLIIFGALLTSCSSGHQPIDLPDNFLDTTPAQVYDPYQPDSICIFTHEKTGSIIGEWMEVGMTYDIISEVSCLTIDTTGFSTRWERRWVFKNDSVVRTYRQDVPIKNDSVDLVVRGADGVLWSYEMRGDSILMVDDHMNRDTLRITRLDGDTMILASVRYKWAFREAERKSVVYIRRR